MMVRTLKQYKFIYDVLFNALLVRNYVVGENMLEIYRQLQKTDPKNDKSYFRQQYETLEKITPELSPAICKKSVLLENADKNRVVTSLAPDKYRPVLKSGAYINAVYFDSYSQRNNYIVTQDPLQETVDDFWELVYEHKVASASSH